jgi:hypothetical protein
MAFPLQDAKCYQTACDVVHLRSRGARLTATQAELILTDANDLFDVRVATHKTIDLVFQTAVYKLKRARRTRSGA